MESFKVFARLRPADADYADGAETYAELTKVATDDQQLRVMKRFDSSAIVQVRKLEFVLDYVWDMHEAQEDVYSRGLKERVSWLLSGFHTTVICYGQTGSGKTHTMFGPEAVLSKRGFADGGVDVADYGIMPRACAQLFDAIAEKHGEATYVVHVSYVEVYNDRLKDLLQAKENTPRQQRGSVSSSSSSSAGAANASSTLALRELSRGGLVVEGLSYTLATVPADVMAAIGHGNERRVVAAMRMNERSSRGHAVVTLHVKEIAGDGSERSSRLTLVDLAGMESSKKSYALEGASRHSDRREEAKHINQSLWALGTVIERLSSMASASANKAHVPYRDSKLTRLLQSSLTGGCKCAFIATLRAEAANLDEAIGTLRFAQRAKAIKVKVSAVATRVDPEVMKGELERTRDELRAAKRAVQEMEAALARAAEEATSAATASAAAAQDHGGGGGTDGDSEGAEQLRRLELKLRLQSSFQATLRERQDAHIAALTQAAQIARQEATELEEALQLRTEELRGAKEDLAMWRRPRSGEATSGGAADEADEPEAPPRLARAQWSSLLLSSGSKVACAHEVTSGGGGGGGGDGASHGDSDGELVSLVGDAADRGDSASAAASAQSGRYERFVEMANARKLALASKGFEVENVFVGQLFDAAERAGVPPEGKARGSLWRSPALKTKLTIVQALAAARTRMRAEGYLPPTELHAVSILPENTEGIGEEPIPPQDAHHAEARAHKADGAPAGTDANSRCLCESDVMGRALVSDDDVTLAAMTPEETRRQILAAFLDAQKAASAAFVGAQQLARGAAADVQLDSKGPMLRVTVRTEADGKADSLELTKEPWKERLEIIFQLDNDTKGARPRTRVVDEPHQPKSWLDKLLCLR